MEDLDPNSFYLFLSDVPGDVIREVDRMGETLEAETSLGDTEEAPFPGIDGWPESGCITLYCGLGTETEICSVLLPTLKRLLDGGARIEMVWPGRGESKLFHA